jgi:catalase
MISHRLTDAREPAKVIQSFLDERNAVLSRLRNGFMQSQVFQRTMNFWPSIIKKTDDFTQAGEGYRSMSKTEMKHLVENLVADLSHITYPAIQKRAVENLAKADEGLGRAVAAGLKLEK